MPNFKQGKAYIIEPMPEIYAKLQNQSLLSPKMKRWRLEFLSNIDKNENFHSKLELSKRNCISR